MKNNEIYFGIYSILQGTPFWNLSHEIFYTSGIYQQLTCHKMNLKRDVSIPLFLTFPNPVSWTTVEPELEQIFPRLK